MAFDQGSSFDAALSAIRSTGIPLASEDALNQAAALLAMQAFAVSTTTGATIFTTKDGESLATAASKRLGSGDMRHFVAGANPAAAQPSVRAVAEQAVLQAIAANPNMSEGERTVLMARHGIHPKHSQPGYAAVAAASADPAAATTNMALPFGIKRIK